MGHFEPINPVGPTGACMFKVQFAKEWQRVQNCALLQRGRQEGSSKPSPCRTTRPYHSSRPTNQPTAFSILPLTSARNCVPDFAGPPRWARSTPPASHGRLTGFHLRTSPRFTRLTPRAPSRGTKNKADLAVEASASRCGGADQAHQASSERSSRDISCPPI